MLTQERLMEVLSYDSDTGVFVWRQKRGRQVNGSVAGSPHNAGYWSIRVDGRALLAHRLAWMYVHGDWPSEIDHINGDRRDNRIANLRHVTRQQNCRNAAMRSHNQTGVNGVAYYQRYRRFRVIMTVDGQSRYLGSFKTLDEAAEVRKSAEAGIQFSERHGKRS
jgi:hypothetical protein